jgi:methylated-DNA-[protein]-cysteine S-methyltransferase
MNKTRVKTTIGPLEITYEAKAVTGIKLVEGPKTPVARPRDVPSFVQDLAHALELHLAGKPQDFSGVPLDFTGLPAFHTRVYKASRFIASGARVTYGELAARVGSPGAARAVGQAMAKNPFFVVVPCHRITSAVGAVSARSDLGGFSAPGGALTKRRMLEIEGAFLEPPPFDVVRALRELRKRDPVLGKVIDQAGDRRPRIEPLTTVFEALGRSIVYQQLSGRAAGAIHRKYAALFPHHRPTPEHLAKLPDVAVRGAGLSGAKLAALRDLGRKTIAGDIPTLMRMRSMTDDAIIESLTRVRGIGPWTVHMLLIFRLGRPDVLPTADYGVRKGFAKTYGKRALPNARTIEKHAERWRPWRSVGSWYMWRALE